MIDLHTLSDLSRLRASVDLECKLAAGRDASFLRSPQSGRSWLSPGPGPGLKSPRFVRLAERAQACAERLPSTPCGSHMLAQGRAASAETLGLAFPAFFRPLAGRTAFGTDSVRPARGRELLFLVDPGSRRPWASMCDPQGVERQIRAQLLLAPAGQPADSPGCRPRDEVKPWLGHPADSSPGGASRVIREFRTSASGGSYRGFLGNYFGASDVVRPPNISSHDHDIHHDIVSRPQSESTLKMSIATSIATSCRDSCLPPASMFPETSESSKCRLSYSHPIATERPRPHPCLTSTPFPTCPGCARASIWSASLRSGGTARERCRPQFFHRRRKEHRDDQE